jgi:hypothetical protein
MAAREDGIQLSHSSRDKMVNVVTVYHSKTRVIIITYLVLMISNYIL